MNEITEAECKALQWLLSGNGQKFISPKTGDGPFEAEHKNLRDVYRDLEKRGLVTVGNPDCHGVRCLRLTDEGRRVAAKPRAIRITIEGGEQHMRNALASEIGALFDSIGVGHDGLSDMHCATEDELHDWTQQAARVGVTIDWKRNSP